MVEFVDSPLERNRFGAFLIKSLSFLADEYGRESDEYLMAVGILKEILSYVRFSLIIGLSCPQPVNPFDIACVVRS